MKKLILFFTVAAVAMTVQSHAQEKGKFWIGGSVGFNNSDQSEPSNNTIMYYFLPEFGYAISDRWATGIRVNTGLSRNEQKNIADLIAVSVKNSSWGIAPFARYTALKWKAFSVFVDGGLSYTREKQDRNQFDNVGGTFYYRDNSERYGIFLQPGFSLRLSRCIALKSHFDFLNVGYTDSRSDNKNINDEASTQSKRKSFLATLNSPFNLESFTVGFTFRF